MYRRKLFASAIRPSLHTRHPIRLPFWQVQAAASYRTARGHDISSDEQAKEILRLKRRAQKLKVFWKNKSETNSALAFFGIFVIGILCFFVGKAGGSYEHSPIYGSKRHLGNAIRELRAALGEGAISTDDEDLRKHGFSEWSSWNISQLPVAIAYPKTTAEVSQIAKCCTKYKIPMIPYSGGSSLEANFSAPHGGISIDMAYMDRIWDVREGDMDVTVQPAVRWTDLNQKIKCTGLFFPVDPGPTAMIGGMIDGEVVVTKRRPRKSAAGYSLNHLFVGSEGTLGIVTEATLKLAPIPQSTSVAVATFPSLRDAASAAAAVIRSGVPVGAMEIMDEVSMNVVNRAGSTPKIWQEVPTLFFKFSGHPAVAKIHETEVLSLASKHNLSSFESTSDPEEQKALWSARKESLWSMLALREGKQEVWPTDVAVPISRLVDMFEEGKAELADLGVFASVLGHIGDGNFHETILYDRSNVRERAMVEAHVRRMTDKALKMDGTCSGEHGIGMSKKDDLVEELGIPPVEMMRKIKKAIDPLWIMNPGKIFNHKLPRELTPAETSAKYTNALGGPYPLGCAGNEPVRHANLSQLEHEAFRLELQRQEFLQSLREAEAGGRDVDELAEIRKRGEFKMETLLQCLAGKRDGSEAAEDPKAKQRTEELKVAELRSLKFNFMQKEFFDRKYKEHLEKEAEEQRKEERVAKKKSKKAAVSSNEGTSMKNGAEA